MINETETFKYWSNKRMDPTKMHRTLEYDRAEFDRQTFEMQYETLDHLYINLLQLAIRDMSKMFTAWSLTLERLAYTEEDILTCTS